VRISSADLEVTEKIEIFIKRTALIAQIVITIEKSPAIAAGLVLTWLDYSLL
jgi:hypothetical protein